MTIPRQSLLWALLWIVAVIVGIVVVVFILPSCADSVARAYPPTVGTVTPTEYDAAEEAFSGNPPPIVPAPYWTDARCQKLLDRRDALLIAAAALGGLTGAGGVATLAPKDVDEKEGRRWDTALGISTLACGSAASTLTLAARTLTSRYEENCRTEKKVFDATAQPVETVDTAATDAPRETGSRTGADPAPDNADAGAQL